MLINCYRYYKHCTKHNYSATKVTFYLLQIINLLHVITNNKSKISGIWTELNLNFEVFQIIILFVSWTVLKSAQKIREISHI